MYTNMEEKPTHIVLGPGGVKGFYMLGTLHKLYDVGYLSEVKRYSGSSVGAIISLLMVCGYSPVEILTVGADARIFQGFFQVDVADRISEMRSNFGITSNIAIRNKLSDAVISKLGMVPTLKQLYMMTGIDFVTTSYNITKSKPVRFNHLSHPNMSAITAVLFSANIPLLFYKLVYEEDTYIDGGFCDPMPIGEDDDRTLGIYVQVSASGQVNNSLSELTHYMQAIVASPIQCLRDIIIRNSGNNCKFIGISSRVVDTTGVSLTEVDKAAMVIDGVRAAEKYLFDTSNKITKYSPDTETQ